MKKWFLFPAAAVLIAGGWLALPLGESDQPRGEEIGQLPVDTIGRDTGPALIGEMALFRELDRPTEPATVVWRTLEGDQISLAEYAGKVVLLNFWATWCGPCMQELPGIDSIAAQLGSDRFAVIAVNLDAEPERNAQAFADRLGLTTLDLFVDPEFRSADALRLRGMPTTYLFDADGQLIGMLEGSAEWDAAESVELLHHYIRTAGDQL